MKLQIEQLGIAILLGLAGIAYGQDTGFEPNISRFLPRNA